MLNRGYISDARLDGIPKVYTYPDADTMVITCVADFGSVQADPQTITKTITFNPDGTVDEEGAWVISE